MCVNKSHSTDASCHERSELLHEGGKQIKLHSFTKVIYQIVYLIDNLTGDLKFWSTVSAKNMDHAKINQSTWTNRGSCTDTAPVEGEHRVNLLYCSRRFPLRQKVAQSRGRHRQTVTNKQPETAVSTQLTQKANTHQQ